MFEQIRLLDPVCESEPWSYLTLLAALVTAHHQEDISRMRFSDARYGRLFMTWSKKGRNLAPSVDLKLPDIGITLNNVIELCRRKDSLQHFIYSVKRRCGRRPGLVRPENMTQAVMRVRDRCGLNETVNPSNFQHDQQLSRKIL
ncbi:hypothetical protein [Pantoea vagans]|uniref:hypothetical protein n=1 Tax=Pantoea vagans TaxID=470934 RepID=UPI0028E3FE07|nr:hypothetical protein [Pantoea vagans]